MDSGETRETILSAVFRLLKQSPRWRDRAVPVESVGSAELQKITEERQPSHNRHRMLRRTVQSAPTTAPCVPVAALRSGNRGSTVVTCHPAHPAILAPSGRVSPPPSRPCDDPPARPGSVVGFVA